MQNSTITPFAENKEILNIEDVAVFFGISTATVRNWTKCGNITPISNRCSNFYLHEIQKVKENIENGNIQKLNGRANKSQADKTFIPDEYCNSNENVDVIHQITSFVQENKIDIKEVLFLLSLNFLKEEGMIQEIGIEDIISNKNIISTNKQINEELNSWQ